MNHRLRQLTLIASLALVAVCIIVLDIHYGGLHVVAALVLVFVLPGYALCAALFPSSTLGSAERLGFTLGLSLSVTVAGGFVLHWTPSGLAGHSWAILLGSVTLIAAAIGWWHQRTDPEATITRRSWHPSFREHVLFVLAALIFGTALGLAHVSAAYQPTPPFTQLWLLPGVDQQSRTVQLGLRNEEAVPTTYMVKLLGDQRAIQEWSTIRLEPGGVWEVTVDLPTDIQSGVAVEGLVFRSDTPTTVYRRAMLWLDHQ